MKKINESDADYCIDGGAECARCGKSFGDHFYPYWCDSGGLSIFSTHQELHQEEEKQKLQQEIVLLQGHIALLEKQNAKIVSDRDILWGQLCATRQQLKESESQRAPCAGCDALPDRPHQAGCPFREPPADAFDEKICACGTTLYRWEKCPTCNE